MQSLETPTPLFRDPIYDGAADPTILWNRQEQAWWLLYTSRRAIADGPGLSWCHGTAIGVASSVNGGQSWLYRGTLQGLDFEPGQNTFWAPEVIWQQGLYHMYVSYIQGIPGDWSGSRSIVHFTSPTGWQWHFESVLALSSSRVIDACVHQMPGGRWRMWYKDEAHQHVTYAAESDDLYHWYVVGPVITDCPHEGPNVFFWREAYWMITDTWRGLAVYRSDDAETWSRQATSILGQPGPYTGDAHRAHHADVLVVGEQALLFYHVHPAGDDQETQTSLEALAGDQRRSWLYAAPLTLEGSMLTCSWKQASLNLPSPGKSLL
jgi:hypothetical protein